MERITGSLALAVAECHEKTRGDSFVDIGERLF